MQRIGSFETQKIENPDLIIRLSKINRDELFSRLDKGEAVTSEEFSQIITKNIQQAISLHQDLAQKVKTVNKLLLHCLYNQSDQPRLRDIHSDHFIAFTKILISFGLDQKIHPLLRIRFIYTTSYAYSAILPKSGLPLTDPHLRGAVTWRNYIIDRGDELGIYDPEFYLENCEYVSGIYLRRAEIAYPRLPLDANNPYIAQAIEYLKKGVAIIEKSDLISYLTAIKFLEQFALLQESFIPRKATLQDEWVKQTIKAYEYCINFNNKPSISNYSLPPTYQSTKQTTASSHLTQRIRGTTTLARSHSASQLHKPPSTSKDLREELSLWKLGEKLNLEHTRDRARAKLGWLYYRTPQEVSQSPNYEKSLQWFLSCKDKSANRVQEALELPEFHSFSNKSRSQPKK
jgi:hypothetical protein